LEALEIPPKIRSNTIIISAKKWETAQKVSLGGEMLRSRGEEKEIGKCLEQYIRLTEESIIMDN